MGAEGFGEGDDFGLGEGLHEGGLLVDGGRPLRKVDDSDAGIRFEQGADHAEDFDNVALGVVLDHCNGEYEVGYIVDTLIIMDVIETEIGDGFISIPGDLEEFRTDIETDRFLAELRDVTGDPSDSAAVIDDCIGRLDELVQPFGLGQALGLEFFRCPLGQDVLPPRRFRFIAGDIVPELYGIFSFHWS